MATLKELIENYEHGVIDFPSLLQAVQTVQPVPSQDPPPRGWGDIYERADQMPDDDDPFWVTVAADLGVISEDEEEQIHNAMGVPSSEQPQP